MTQHEKKALLTYLDGQLMVLCQNVKPHLDPDAAGTLYESVYSLLQDLQETIIPTDEVAQAVTRKLKK